MSDQPGEPVEIKTPFVTLEGNLHIPENSAGVIIFAHGSGSSRHSSRNQQVARMLADGGLATLLIDLLTADEEVAGGETGDLRFDLDMLANRMIAVTDWVDSQSRTQSLQIGYFGASTGAGAALVAAAERPQLVGAVVSRGGRPDLAGDSLARVEAPTLLIVGGEDAPVIQMNQDALALLKCKKQLEIIPRATHLFEEPGALDAVANLTLQWFRKYLS